MDEDLLSDLEERVDVLEGGEVTEGETHRAQRFSSVSEVDIIRAAIFVLTILVDLIIRDPEVVVAGARVAVTASADVNVFVGGEVLNVVVAHVRPVGVEDVEVYDAALFLRPLCVLSIDAEDRSAVGVVHCRHGLVEVASERPNVLSDWGYVAIRALGIGSIDSTGAVLRAREDRAQGVKAVAELIDREE